MPDQLATLGELFDTHPALGKYIGSIAGVVRSAGNPELEAT